MSIPQSKYVAITSAVANTAEAPYKELILRVLTSNPLFGANTIYEFTSSDNVSAFAGSLSAESKLASEYFGWVSKRAQKAAKISFMRYSFEALAPYIYSTQKLTALDVLKAVTNGSMVINMGGSAYTLSSIDFSSATSYSDIAATLQAAIRANTAGDALWTGATVTYSAENTSFILTGGATGANEIGYATASSGGSDISSLIGWNLATQPVLSAGTTAQTITDILNKSVDISTNFLTFGFIDPADAFNNLDAIGQFVQEQNFNYRFCFDLSPSNYTTGIAIANKYDGMTAHYNINYGIEGINPAWLMSAILPATTDYATVNGVKNYMFQEFPAQAVSVGLDDDGTLYQTLDNLAINYNGRTQKSGKTIAFYQNGFNANGTDTAVFDNEAWLKDHIATDILNAFLALDFISADRDGEAIITGILENNAEMALNNHVFAKGQTLDNSQKGYITQILGDADAWLDVQTNGYKFKVSITTEASGQSVIHVGKYLLVYLKNNVIRKVEGQNVLV